MTGVNTAIFEELNFKKLSGTTVVLLQMGVKQNSLSCEFIGDEIGFNAEKKKCE